MEGSGDRIRMTARHADVTDAEAWRFAQARNRLDQIDRTVLDYGAQYNLPVRRVDSPPVATWVLGGTPAVRFIRADRGPDRLEVSEVGLLSALRRLRSGHLVVDQG
jgi:hypothetical protein